MSIDQCLSIATTSAIAVSPTWINCLSSFPSVLLKTSPSPGLHLQNQIKQERQKYAQGEINAGTRPFRLQQVIRIVSPLMHISDQSEST